MRELADILSSTTDTWTGEERKHVRARLQGRQFSELEADLQARLRALMAQCEESGRRQQNRVAMAAWLVLIIVSVAFVFELRQAEPRPILALGVLLAAGGMLVGVIAWMDRRRRSCLCRLTGLVDCWLPKRHDKGAVRER